MHRVLVDSLLCHPIISIHFNELLTSYFMLLCIDMKILCLYFLISIGSCSTHSLARTRIQRNTPRTGSAANATGTFIQITNENGHQIYSFAFFWVVSLYFFLFCGHFWSHSRMDWVSFNEFAMHRFDTIWYRALFIYTYLFRVATWAFFLSWYVWFWSNGARRTSQ